MSTEGNFIELRDRSPELLEANLEDRYLVIFDDEGDVEKGPRVLSRALNLKPAAQTMSDPGPTRLMSAMMLRAKAFGDLGIATVSMSRDQARDLAAGGEVLNVLRVQPRKLPVTIRSAFLRSRPAGMEADLAGLAGSIGPNEPIPDDPHAAYLLGARDALGLALSSYRAAKGHTGNGRVRALESGGVSWGLDAVRVGATYHRLTGSGVKVAVIDTGVSTGHPDLARKITPENVKSFVKDRDVEDSDGHGTHCAGVATGPAMTAGECRYGIAPDAELIVARVFDDAGNTDDEIVIDAIQWAASRGARIISLSLGSPRSPEDPYSVAYERVASRLLRRERGAICIAAAGNESRRRAGRTAAVADPAACPSIVAVAAVDDRLAVADFSNREKDAVGGLDVSAPGVDIYSTYLAGKYEVMSGTSMATPHASGVAALILEENPAMSADDLRVMLVAGAKHLGDRLDYGAGIVQAP